MAPRFSAPFASGLLHFVATAVALTGTAAYAQLSDPIPGAITKQGLRVQIEDFVQMPNTVNSTGSKPSRASGSDARINFLREAPDGRLFVNDLRGQIYAIDRNSGQFNTFVDIDADNGGSSSLLPDTWFDGGLAAGLISFEFHPEYASNGVFYTIHMERDQDVAATPDFETIDLRGPAHPTKWHTIVTEWDGADPSAATWNEATGSRRELLRVGTTASSYFHPFGDLQFNPTAAPGDVDYGNLYISGGDWGYINGAGAPQGSDATGQPEQLQRLDTLAGTMLRIDPRSPSETGGIAGIGDYTVPASNPFVDGDTNTFDEIYAYGFRNGHRMAWDDDGTLFVSNVGSKNIEEVERIVPGGNYGWAEREGTFISGTDTSGNNDEVFPINLTPAEDIDARGQPFLYPTAQYDHDEGFAIAGGFVYQGSLVPQLQGKFVFGDIVNGRLFAADVATMKSVDLTDPTTTAGIEEIQLFTKDQQGAEDNVDLRPDYFNGGRVDLRFGQTDDGEIWILTKTDGYVRRLVGEGTIPQLQAIVNRETGEVQLTNSSGAAVTLDGYTLSSDLGGLRPADGAWLSLEDQATPGWEEASPTTVALSELNASGDLTLGPGQSVTLGQAYGGAEIAFGVSQDDVELEYRLPNGEILDGSVVYEGQGANKTLQLIVDPVSGEASLVNGSSFAVSLTGYSILSDSDALSPGGWQSLSDQGEPEWDEASPGDGALSELVSSGGALVDDGEGFDLATILATTSSEDLVLEFLVEGEASPRQGQVIYRLRGDFNGDGSVDAADYTVWRDGSVAADQSGPTTGVPDGVVDSHDYDLWRAHFGAALANSSEGQVQTVPEPAGLVSIAAALLLAQGACRCRR